MPAPEYSIAERVAQAVQDALQPHLPGDPGITGIEARVERARADTITREDGDTINIESENEQLRPFDDGLDDCELTLAVQIYVTAAAVWESTADAIAIQAHRRIRAYDYLVTASLKVAKVRRVEGDWDADQGDKMPGRRTLKYAFRFFTFADDITKQP